MTTKKKAKDAQSSQRGIASYRDELGRLVRLHVGISASVQSMERDLSRQLESAGTPQPDLEEVLKEIGQFSWALKQGEITRSLLQSKDDRIDKLNQSADSAQALAIQLGKDKVRLIRANQSLATNYAALFSKYPEFQGVCTNLTNVSTMDEAQELELRTQLESANRLLQSKEDQINGRNTKLKQTLQSKKAEISAGSKELEESAATIKALTAQLEQLKMQTNLDRLKQLEPLQQEIVTWYNREVSSGHVMLSLFFLCLIDLAQQQCHALLEVSSDLDFNSLAEHLFRLCKVGPECAENSYLYRNSPIDIHTPDDLDRLKSQFSSQFPGAIQLNSDAQEDIRQLLGAIDRDYKPIVGKVYWIWEGVIGPFLKEAQSLVQEPSQDSANIIAGYITVKAFNLYCREYITRYSR